MWIAHLVEISLRYFSGEMRRAVDGLLTDFRVLTVVTFATGLVEVLRVRVLRGALGAVAIDLEAVDLRGINSLLRAYP